MLDESVNIDLSNAVASGLGKKAMVQGLTHNPRHPPCWKYERSER